ncbi:MAG: RecQ family ATP-dependent DNA helicase [Chloroflexota bacterium]
MNNNKQTILQSLQLEPGHLASLPPDIRSQLLDYVAIWAENPDELIDLVGRLREEHGPLLFLLDYQASAHLDKQDYQQALELIERRQRRSTTVATQALEAKTLLAAGYETHAQAVVDDISQAYKRNSAAISAAIEVYTGLGQFNHAKDMADAYLTLRPGDLQVNLTLARSARQAGQQDTADNYVQRMGGGIPANITDKQLQQLRHLYHALGNQESTAAADVELTRRQQLQWQKLQQSLSPFTNLTVTDGTDGVVIDAAQLYRNLSGPESIKVDRKEKRDIKLEAVRHFGFMKLRTGQVEIIATILRGDSMLAVMPTGAGKSLCYQLPALTLPKATLVISPLIALMKDQVESLPANARQQATFINSTLEEEELERRMEGIAQSKYKLIYAAPERLRQRAFLRALRSAGLDLFVVDEAHCVSMWGHDFRPDYLFIQEARHELGNPRSLAMTATAPPRVRDEIVDYMSSERENPETGIAPTLDRPQVMSLDIFRDNLHLSALRFNSEEEKLGALTKFVSETEGSGIVYVNSRHKSEMLAYNLVEAGVAAKAYHAGLSDRGAVQDSFMNDETRVVVATVAFGMGIDKSDIRFIVHFHPSRSLAAYYQEVGRAGRDGKPSQGVLFYSNNDWANLRRWGKSDQHTYEFLEKVYKAVATQLGVHLQKGEESVEDTAENGVETDEPEITFNFNPSFDPSLLEEPAIGPVDARRLKQVLNTDETTVRVAVSMLERADLLSRSFDFPREIEIGLPQKVPAAVKKDAEFVKLIKGLRLKLGKRANYETSQIADFLGWPLHETEAWLLDWQAKGFIKVKGSRRSMLIEMPPQPDDMQERLERLLSQSAALGQRRIDDIIGYATAETCRHGYISAHFGSPPRNKCKVCDSCTGIKPDIPEPKDLSHTLPDDADVEPMIIDCLVSLPKPVGRSGLARILTGSLRAPVKPNEARHHGSLKAMGEATVMNYIDSLLEDTRLRQYERQGYPVLAATVKGRTEAELWLVEHPELMEKGPEPEISPDAEGEAEAPAEGDKYTALQKALWLWRRRTADEQGQPPYVIMSNELMLRIAEVRPQSLDELGAMQGMGMQRLQYYGPTILDLINLNPLDDGDDALLQEQRTNLVQTQAKVREAFHAQAQAVSPKVERRIYMKLQEMRQKKSITQGQKSYAIASNTLMKNLSKVAPESLEELDKMVGFRSSGIKDDAEAILAIIKEARALDG